MVEEELVEVLLALVHEDVTERLVEPKRLSGIWDRNPYDLHNEDQTHIVGRVDSSTHRVEEFFTLEPVVASENDVLPNRKDSMINKLPALLVSGNLNAHLVDELLESIHLRQGILYT